MKGNTFFKPSLSIDEFEKIAKYFPIVNPRDVPYNDRGGLPPKSEDAETFSEPKSNAKLEQRRREKDEPSDIEETDDEKPDERSVYEQ